MNSAKAGLGRLLKKMERDPDSLRQYHNIIQDQINRRIVEAAPGDPITSFIYHIDQS
jgi:hypothetical protein